MKIMKILEMSAVGVFGNFLVLLAAFRFFCQFFGAFEHFLVIFTAAALLDSVWCTWQFFGALLQFLIVLGVLGSVLAC